MSGKILVLKPFESQSVLALCGPNHSLLSNYESQYQVNIELIGDELWITGDERSEKTVYELLKNSYHELVSSKNICPVSTDDANKKHVSKTINIHGKSVKLATDAQYEYMQKILDHTLVFATGPAGTGKTFLAVVMALYHLSQGWVDKIILSRPAVDAGEKLGFLPGDLNEKVDPYLRPFFDELLGFLGQEKLQSLLDQKRIEIAPIAFMRGRTLKQAFIVIDECQNTSFSQMKMILTRLGHGSKMVLVGDLTQNDLPNGQQSGLEVVLPVLRSIKAIAFHEFSSADNVRHDLITEMIRAFERAKL